MRRTGLVVLCLLGTVALGACNRSGTADVDRALKSVNVIDESNLSEIMLTVGDPDEAVAYFARASSENPDRADLRRGLAKSLVRAGKPQEASAVWAALVASPAATAAYVVAPGDSLYKIALEQLGNGNRWSEIYSLNQSVIGDNPRLIRPGQQLALPQ